MRALLNKLMTSGKKWVYCDMLLSDRTTCNAGQDQGCSSCQGAPPGQAPGACLRLGTRDTTLGGATAARLRVTSLVLRGLQMRRHAAGSMGRASP